MPALPHPLYPDRINIISFQKPFLDGMNRMDRILLKAFFVFIPLIL